jgi:hypothetical protein
MSGEPHRERHFTGHGAVPGAAVWQVSPRAQSSGRVESSDRSAVTHPFN